MDVWMREKHLLHRIICCVICIWGKNMQRLEGRREPVVMGTCRWWVHVECGPRGGKARGEAARETGIAYCTPDTGLLYGLSH